MRRVSFFSSSCWWAFKRTLVVWILSLFLVMVAATQTTNKHATTTSTRGGLEPSLLQVTLLEKDRAPQVLDWTRSSGPWKIDNELFKGQVHLFVQGATNYDFEGETNVYWEVQLQGQFQRPLQGPLYLATELPPEQAPVRLSWPLKFMLQAVMTFCRHWGYDSIHMSLGGKGEVPHLAVAALQSFDRVVRTPSSSSSPPPRLGQPIPELGVSARHRRQKGGWRQWQQEVNTQDMYTLSFNHTYFHPLDWKLHGIPLVSEWEVSFANTLRLTLYEVVEEKNDAAAAQDNVVPTTTTGPHSHRNVAMCLQLSREEPQLQEQEDNQGEEGAHQEKEDAEEEETKTETQVVE